MRKALFPTILAGALLIAPGYSISATSQTQSAPPPASHGAVMTREMTTSAVVEDVDPQAHQVLLRLPDETLVTLKVNPRAVNLADLKPGDHVTARYVAARLIRINGTPPHAGPLQTIASGQGEALHGGTTIVAVDPTGHTVSFVGPGNVVQTIHVAGNAMIEAVTKLHGGDRADVAYAPAMVVSLHHV